MKLSVFILALFLIGCSEEKSIAPEIETSSKVENEERIDTVQTAPDLEAEARLNPVLDALTKQTFNLSSSCNADTKIHSEKGKIILGAMKCEVKDVTVYLGSTEIEYKVDACVINQESVDVSFFAFGSNQINSYCIVSDDEVRKPVFVCP